MNSTAYVVRDAQGRYFCGHKHGRCNGRFVEHLNEAMLYKGKGTASGLATKLREEYRDEDEGVVEEFVVVPVEIILQTQ